MKGEQTMSKVVVNNSISTTSLLGVAFVILKLTNYIDWPWLWVLSPFWLPASIILGIMLALLLGAAFFWLLGSLLEFMEKKK